MKLRYEHLSAAGWLLLLFGLYAGKVSDLVIFALILIYLPRITPTFKSRE